GNPTWREARPVWVLAALSLPPLHPPTATTVAGSLSMGVATDLMLQLTMQTQLARSGRSLRRGSTAGWRWGRTSGERSLRLYRRGVKACVGAENRRPVRIAMRTPLLRPAGLEPTLLQRRGAPGSWPR